MGSQHVAHIMWRLKKPLDRTTTSPWIEDAVTLDG
jgi:hypothetical protein